MVRNTKRFAWTRISPSSQRLLDRYASGKGRSLPSFLCLGLRNITKICCSHNANTFLREINTGISFHIECAEKILRLGDHMRTHQRRPSVIAIKSPGRSDRLIKVVLNVHRHLMEFTDNSENVVGECD